MVVSNLQTSSKSGSSLLNQNFRQKSMVNAVTWTKSVVGANSNTSQSALGPGNGFVQPQVPFFAFQYVEFGFPLQHELHPWRHCFVACNPEGAGFVVS